SGTPERSVAVIDAFRNDSRELAARGAVTCCVQDLALRFVLLLLDGRKSPCSGWRPPAGWRGGWHGPSPVPGGSRSSPRPSGRTGSSTTGRSAASGRPEAAATALNSSRRRISDDFIASSTST